MHNSRESSSKPILSTRAIDCNLTVNSNPHSTQVVCYVDREAIILESYVNGVITYKDPKTNTVKRLLLSGPVSK